MSKITVEEFNALVNAELPFAAELGLMAESITDGEARVRLPFRQVMIRPGGTIAGPIMMGLVDATMFAALLGRIGHVEMAVTTSLNINFLRRPPQADLVAEGRVIKAGKRLGVMEVTVYTDGDEDPVAHATGTYSIPPKNKES
jgi:uncharacterized protein (TIGR00369 family)